MNKATRTTSLRQHKLTFLKDNNNSLQLQTRSQSFKQNISISPDKKSQISPTKQNSVFLNGQLLTRPRSKYNQQANLSTTKLQDSQKVFLIQQAQQQQAQQQRAEQSPALHRKQQSDKVLKYDLPKISPIKARLPIKQLQPDMNQLDLFKREQIKQNLIKSAYTKSQAGKNEDNLTKTNQDSFISLQSFKDNMSLFGVCDGHGQEGHKCSQFIRDNLPKNISSQLSQNPSSIIDSISKSFNRTNTQLCNAEEIITTFSGSTTVISLIVDDTIYTANVGDSRSIICRLQSNGVKTAISLSNDHKPDLPQERRRIEQSGGRVEPYIDFDGSSLGPSRVWLKTEDIPGLAMSRSFGDKVAASCGVICEPEILTHKIQEGDLFMVLASDGVWEFLSNEQVIDMIYPYYVQDEGNAACVRIVKESIKLWKLNDTVIDDITIVIVFFNKQK
ncbi:unnamed protein product (macronuclear) [Paramecium tetraurelia]|uniref:PPM-type phosphatase domain-containing protein n=1 Tax=Paramecium tetraurelia TaxID=5888 RepID=A0BCA9_PARTE|nr:uncharacterized protein GSPATT00004270001 [Paramecium tetraurelia]CAK56176.1 unnamed protein product [Paramecium tetraurelia]|eukprot:XP_001423574.1 hypothetical protein (macronuclear) [Paramecium tetraurelia strain d4-2]